jgi:hypothetical protein
MAGMRDRTRSRRYSPEREEFRRTHERQRAWGLARRHREKARRLQGDAAARLVASEVVGSGTPPRRPRLPGEALEPAPQTASAKRPQMRRPDQPCPAMPALAQRPVAEPARPPVAEPAQQPVAEPAQRPAGEPTQQPAAEPPQPAGLADEPRSTSQLAQRPAPGNAGLCHQEAERTTTPRETKEWLRSRTGLGVESLPPQHGRAAVADAEAACGVTVGFRIGVAALPASGACVSGGLGSHDGRR